jgi:hypothetical protein
VPVFNNPRFAQRPERDAWFSVALKDAPTFQMVLANSALHLGSFRNGDEYRETPLSIQYQTLVIRSINARLAISTVTEDMLGTIAAIIGYYVGSIEAWQKHQVV